VGRGLVEFESTLERDFIVRCRFDRAVETVEAQPVRIAYTVDGSRRTRVPDFLVTYSAAARKPPLLCDIKYRAELRGDWLLLKPKLEAAYRYALARGWRYRIFTERQIRTQLLVNARFLLRFDNPHVEYGDEQSRALVIQSLDKHGPQSVAQLTADRLQHLPSEAALPLLWALIARGAVLADLNAPLTRESTLWLPT